MASYTYLDMPDQVIRQRVENHMQGRLREQALQMDALVDRYTDLFDGEVARFARAHERTHPITTDIVTVQWLNEQAMQGLRDTVNEHDPAYRAWEAEHAAAVATEAAIPAMSACRLREAGFLPLPRLRTGRESFPSSSSSISKAL
jgi:hypothetical protein